MNNLIDDPEYAETARRMRQSILGWLRETGHDYVEEIALNAKSKQK
jgi:hypothetical protein